MAEDREESARILWGNARPIRQRDASGEGLRIRRWSRRAVASVESAAGASVAIAGRNAEKTAAELRAYIDGRDPISRRPVMQEVIEALTRPWFDGDGARAGDEGVAVIQHG